MSQTAELPPDDENPSFIASAFARLKNLLSPHALNAKPAAGQPSEPRMTDSADSLLAQLASGDEDEAPPEEGPSELKEIADRLARLAAKVAELENARQRASFADPSSPAIRRDEQHAPAEPHFHRPGQAGAEPMPSQGKRSGSMPPPAVAALKKAWNLGSTAFSILQLVVGVPGIGQHTSDFRDRPPDTVETRTAQLFSQVRRRENEEPEPAKAREPELTLALGGEATTSAHAAVRPGTGGSPDSIIGEVADTTPGPSDVDKEPRQLRPGSFVINARDSQKPETGRVLQAMTGSDAPSPSAAPGADVGGAASSPREGVSTLLMPKEKVVPPEIAQIPENKAVLEEINSGKTVPSHRLAKGGEPSPAPGDPGEPAFSGPLAPAFYSRLRAAVLGLGEKPLPVEAVRNRLAKSGKEGFSAEEWQWTQMDAALRGRKTVTRDDLLRHLDENEVRVGEVVSGPERAPRFASHQTPGGENYREMVLTLPQRELPDGYSFRWIDAPHAPTGKTVEILDDNGNVVLGDAYYPDEEKALAHFNSRIANRSYGHENHWPGIANPLAHIRFNDREGDFRQDLGRKEKILHVEEIQSDWHQAGRHTGYASIPEFKEDVLRAARKNGADLGAVVEALDHICEAPLDTQKRPTGPQWKVLHDAVGEDVDLNRIHDIKDHRGLMPDAPFKETWHELALKRMLRYAAEHGYDRITLNPGEQINDVLGGDPQSLGGQAKFYGTNLAPEDLGQQIHQGLVDAFDPKRELVRNPEQAESLLNNPLTRTETDLLTGKLDPTAHATELVKNPTLPNSLAKLGKQYGAKAEPYSLAVGTQSADGAGGSLKTSSLPITPELRRSVLGKGQALMAEGGEVPECGETQAEPTRGVRAVHGEPPGVASAARSSIPSRTRVERAPRDFVAPSMPSQPDSQYLNAGGNVLGTAIADVVSRKKTEDHSRAVTPAVKWPDHPATEKFRNAIDAANLPDDQKAEYAQAAAQVLGTMPASALGRVASNLHKANYYADSKTMALAAIGKMPPSPAVDDIRKRVEQGEIAPSGGYDRLHEELHLAPPASVEGTGLASGRYPYKGGDAREVYSHELGHVVDGPKHELSSTPDWEEAWQSEIAGLSGGAKLTEYAAENPKEAFAEFARLVYGGGDLRAVAKDFPKAAAFFKGRELWPAEKRPQATGGIMASEPRQHFDGGGDVLGAAISGVSRFADLVPTKDSSSFFGRFKKLAKTASTGISLLQTLAGVPGMNAAMLPPEVIAAQKFSEPKTVATKQADGFLKIKRRENDDVRMQRPAGPAVHRATGGTVDYASGGTSTASPGDADPSPHVRAQHEQGYATDAPADRTTSEPFKKWFGDWEQSRGNSLGSVLSSAWSSAQSSVFGSPKKPHEVSRVVDQAGRPKTVYHGTNAEFEAFDTGKQNAQSLMGPGFYFSESEGVANSWKDGNAFRPEDTDTASQPKKPRVIAAHLNIRNPFDADAHLDRLATAPSLAKFPYSFISDVKGGNKDATEELKRLGYDGIAHLGSLEGPDRKRSRVWVAFEPNQIKSTDNEGTYNPSDPRMHKAEGGEISPALARGSGQADIDSIQTEPRATPAPTGADSPPFSASGPAAQPSEPALASPLDATAGAMRAQMATRSPAFKKWFGDWENEPEKASKVVDEAGRPRRVYHGTQRNFQAFGADHVGSGSGKGLADTESEAYFFTPDEAYGDKYASGMTLNDQHDRDSYPRGASVVPAFLDMKNPLVAYDYEMGFTPGDIKYHIDEAKESGSDGVITRSGYPEWWAGEANEDGEVARGKLTEDYVVFKPTQIKSAIANEGSFNPSDPRIHKAEGGSVDAPNDSSADENEVPRAVPASPRNPQVPPWGQEAADKAEYLRKTGDHYNADAFQRIADLHAATWKRVQEEQHRPDEPDASAAPAEVPTAIRAEDVPDVIAVDGPSIAGLSATRPDNGLLSPSIAAPETSHCPAEHGLSANIPHSISTAIPADDVPHAIPLGGPSESSSLPPSRLPSGANGRAPSSAGGADSQSGDPSAPTFALASSVPHAIPIPQVTAAPGSPFQFDDFMGGVDLAGKIVDQMPRSGLFSGLGWESHEGLHKAVYGRAYGGPRLDEPPTNPFPSVARLGRSAAKLGKTFDRLGKGKPFDERSLKAILGAMKSLPHKADGGDVPSVPIKATAGEFMVGPEETSKFKPLLQAINNDQVPAPSTPRDRESEPTAVPPSSPSPQVPSGEIPQVPGVAPDEDEVPVDAPVGSFIVRKQQAEKFKPQLRDISEGRVPRFAQGGQVNGGTKAKGDPKPDSNAQMRDMALNVASIAFPEAAPFIKLAQASGILDEGGVNPMKALAGFGGEGASGGLADLFGGGMGGSMSELASLFGGMAGEQKSASDLSGGDDGSIQELVKAVRDLITVLKSDNDAPSAAAGSGPPSFGQKAQKGRSMPLEANLIAIARAAGMR